MKAVWKFKITKFQNQTVAMPADARILTAQWQGDSFAIWAMVEPNRALEDRQIFIVGTGTNLHDKMSLAYRHSSRTNGRRCPYFRETKMNTEKKGCPIDSPRLTESLTGPKHPNECQSCGGSKLPGFGNGILRLTVDRWQEHDHRDEKELRVVVLCEKCARRLIEQHPRLYEKLPANQPWAGAMAICVDCRLRDGVKCTSPRAKVNGGDGVAILIDEPIRALIDGKNYRGPVALFRKPAHGCDQREAIK